METKFVDITMHIDESLQPIDLELLRDSLLKTNGVMAADYHRRAPHLMIIGYDPDKVNSEAFLKIAQQKGIHAELVGL